MHAALQTGGHSPKPVCGPASTSQLKTAPDCLPNSGTLPSSLSKGKKRERGDHGYDPLKRERVSKPEDSDICHLKTEAWLKSEIMKFAGRGGGLVDTEGVENLLHLITPETEERKLDLASRSLLAGVIVATENSDCLSRFVQFKGLALFDEWIQDIHKGKINGSRYCDDFILVMLRALDNLPVDLDALQTCNIGKSVNHLRTHKNFEIQKKARILIDTWKKRVKAEFNNQDMKHGPPPAVQWPSRIRNPDVLHPLNQQTGGRSSESATKSSLTQASVPRSTPVKPGPGDTVKSTAVGLSRCVSSVSLSRIGPVSDQTVIREDNIFSSGQHMNTIPSSNNQVKVAGISSMEEHRNSSKTPLGTPTVLKSVNDMPTSGVQRETHILSRVSSPHQNICSNSGMANDVCEAVTAAPDDSCPKLIVKIPNFGRSTSVRHHEDQSLFRTESPSAMMPESHDRLDCGSKDTNNLCGTNAPSDAKTESWQSNDFKDVFTASEEGDDPLAPSVDDCCVSGNTAEKAVELPQATSLSSENESNPSTTPETSSGLKNVKADGSVKISDGAEISGPTAPPTGDDSGMNLLASVAAGEIQSTGHSNSTFPKTDVVCSDPPLMDSKKEAGFRPEEKDNDQNDPASFSCLEMQPASNTSLVETKSGIMCADLTTCMCSSCVTERLEDGECIKCKQRMMIDTSAVSEDGMTESTPELVISLQAEGQPDNILSVAQGEECERVKTENGGNVCPKSSDPKSDSCLGPENQIMCHPLSKLSGIMVELVGENLGNKKNDRPSSGGPVSEKRRRLRHTDSKLSSVEVEETDECASSTAAVSSFSASDSDTDSRPGFDLNEGIMADDGRSGDMVHSERPECSNSEKVTTSFSLPISPFSMCVSSSVTIAAAAKGPFMPLGDLMRSRSEPGWKGSAATSAFRPAEPRRAPETPQIVTSECEQGRHMLDFDLNVPDESTFEEMIFRTPCDPSTSVNNSYSSHDFQSARSSVGFDLDLNQADISAEGTPSSTPACKRLQLFPPNPFSDDPCRSKFDLNNGPGLDESSMISPFFCRNMRSGPSSQETASCIKMNSSEPGSFSSWFPPGMNARPTISIPTVFSGTVDPSFYPMVGAGAHPRILTASTGGGHFHSDTYQMPVMPPSPAISFQPSPFQYHLFPFGATLPLPSTTFSVGSAPYVDSSSSGRGVPFHAIQTQILAHPSVVSAQFQRPYAVRLPDGCSASTFESGRRRIGQILDLNDGPLGPDVEGRGEVIPAVLRQQHSVSSSVVDHATRMYQMASGALKKRDSEGGWDISYRQPSCQ